MRIFRFKQFEAEIATFSERNAVFIEVSGEFSPRFRYFINFFADATGRGNEQKKRDTRKIVGKKIMISTSEIIHTANRDA